MIIAASIKKLLENSKYPYRVLNHKRVTNLKNAANLLKIDLREVLEVQVLTDNSGMVMVVHPHNRKLDLALLQQAIRRKLTILPSINVNRIFNDCEAGSWPAVGHAYNLEIILDKSIQQLDTVYFASGSHTSILQMSKAAFLQLNSRSKSLHLTQEVIPHEAELALMEPESDFAKLTMPLLPPVAMQILRLSLSREHSTKELIELITQDPGILQQISYYMQLPFIKKQYQPADNQTPSPVAHAVEHVLGFDTVSHIALGVAAGRAFDKERTLAGNANFWRHAFYAAIYAQQITKAVAANLKLDPAISYLAGIFHNFGLLLLSQLFPPEYNLLNKWLQQNPKICIAVLEKKILGMGRAFDVARGGHAQLGEWLLRSWQLPEAICVITKEHHNTKYDGPYAAYVKIIQLTNQLLRQEGIGDGTISGVKNESLAALNLNFEQLNAIIKQIKDSATSLDNMARFLTSL